MKTVSDFARAQERAGTAAVDIAVAQMLALAELANVRFDVDNGRLVMCAAHMDQKLWPPVRSYLDEIGVDAIVDYFERHGRAERAALSAAA